MINKIISATWILLVLVGCSKEDDNGYIGVHDPCVINFITQATKATISDIATMQSDINGFVVYGSKVGDSDWYDNIDGNRYTYNSDSQTWEWQSSEVPSWPLPFEQMNFYAYYPSSAEGFALSATATSSIIGEIVVESSILNQTDYIAACSDDILEKPISGLLPLDFGHIMSKISFSVLQDDGVLTVIRQLGVENIIDRGSYDYINSEWLNLSNTNIGSFSDYVGSSGVFAKYGVENQIDPIRIDNHYLMLIPQSGGAEDNQTPIWDGSITLDDSGELVPDGAYISIRYRTNNDTEDIVGYAFRQTSTNDSEWTDNNYFYSVYKKNGGKYNGPLYVKAAFKLSTELLDWISGVEYNYTLPLNKIGGIYLSEYYYDVDGTNTKIRVNGNPDVGDTVYITDITIEITIEDWVESESNDTSLSRCLCY